MPIFIFFERRFDTMKNQKQNNARFYMTIALREELRLQAVEVSTRLSRSVARLTSCEVQPCLEYGEEVQYQQELGQKLYYIQHCRNALERCIGGGSATLRYRWPDGTVSRTYFRMAGQNRVKVTGLSLG